MSDERTTTAARTPVVAPAPAPAGPVEPATADVFSFTAPRPDADLPAGPHGDPAARTASRPALVLTSTALAVVVLTAFLVLVVSGRVVTEGPVVLVLTPSHGVHRGDLLALAAWAAAVGPLLASALAAPLVRSPLKGRRVRSRRGTTSAGARRRR